MPQAQVRRVLRRQDYAKRGLVALMALALVLGLVWLRSSGTFGGPDHVSAQLADAGGSLGNGADVKVRGVIIGKVVGVTRGPEGGVRVRLAVDHDRLGRVPANVVARILPATVFGTSFVDLVNHETPSPRGLRNGAVIAADRTQGTLELQQALDDIDALVKAVGPAELASAIGSAAQALDGRGEQLGRTIERANGYLGRLNPRMPQLRLDVTKLATNLELANQVAPDLLKATNDALVAARTVVQQKASIVAVISGGTSLANQATTFLETNRAKLLRFVDNAAVLLDIVYDTRHQAITGSIMTNRMLAAKLSSIDKHGFVDAVTTLQLDVPGYYTRADCPRYGRATGDNCSGSARLNRVGVSTMLGGSR